MDLYYSTIHIRQSVFIYKATNLPSDGSWRYFPTLSNVEKITFDAPEIIVTKKMKDVYFV